MPQELRLTAFEYASTKSQKRFECLLVNFDHADLVLKAKLKALGMRWAPEGKYFYFRVPEGMTAQSQTENIRQSKASKAHSSRFSGTADRGIPLTFNIRTCSTTWPA